MKKLLFFSVFLAFVAECLPAQSGQFVQAPIIVQRGDLAFQATTLDEAIGSVAQDGDLIYLPGGSFNLSVAINKNVHIYGTGWRSDSTKATGETIIYPGIVLNSGASGGSLNGVYVQGNVRNVTGQALTSYSISRCRTMWIDFVNNQSTAFNCTIHSSVIRYVNFYAGTLNLTNSIVEERFYCAGNSLLHVDHCILFHLGGNTLFESIDAVNLSNSIIFHQAAQPNNLTYILGFLEISNCLFAGNPAGVPAWLPGYNNNIVENLDFRAAVFLNYPGNQYFQQEYDFHLKDTPLCNQCDGKGIYAGPTPYRDVPENPYVTARSVNISPNGQQLLLNFTVNKGAN